MHELRTTKLRTWQYRQRCTSVRVRKEKRRYQETTYYVVLIREQLEIQKQAPAISMLSLLRFAANTYSSLLCIPRAVDIAGRDRGRSWETSPSVS